MELKDSPPEIDMMMGEDEFTESESEVAKGKGKEKKKDYIDDY